MNPFINQIEVDGVVFDIKSVPVQERGASTEDAMSQDAVTKELDTLDKIANVMISTDTTVETISPDNTLSDIVYSTNFTNGTTLSGYNTYEKTVVPGEKYLICTAVPAHSAYAVALFFNEDGYVSGQGFNETGALWYVVDYEVTVPEGCTLMRTSSLKTTTYIIKKLIITETIYDPKAIDQEISQRVETLEEDFESVQEDINKVSEIADALMQKESHVETISADNTLSNIVYSSTFTNGTTLSGYNTYEKTVVPGEKYLICTAVPAHSAYAVALFFNEDGYVSGQGFNETGALWYVVDYEVTVPEGCTLMRTSSLKTTTYIIKKLIITETIYDPKAADQEIIANIGKSIGYELTSDNILNVSVKYGLRKDLAITLQCKGGNNLFDFYRGSILENSGPSPSINFGAFTQIFSSTTDWHAPFQVAAVNNIDGDNINDSGNYRIYFTGGNHQYNNTGSGSTPTARTSSLRFFIDGAEILEGKGYASRIEIRWTNLVQGYNTTKADGTGREILREDHVLKFNGVDWVSEVQLTPLEEVNIPVWYGFQASTGSVTNPVYNQTVRYIGAENRNTHDATSVSSDCGGIKCRSVVCSGEAHCLEIELDETYDLGNHAFNSSKPACFVSDYNKVYYHIINYKNELPAGAHYYLRGIYRFYPV